MSMTEKYIQDYTRKCSNELVWIINTGDKEIRYYHPWLTPDNARSVAEIAREEAINKACEWIYQQQIVVPDMEKFIADFKKYMES